MEAQSRQGWTEFFERGRWQLKADCRAASATSLADIDKKAHDFLHSIKREMGIEVVSQGVAVLKEAAEHSHLHLLMSRYESGASFEGMDLEAMARLWHNGARWSEGDCVIRSIYDLHGAAEYVASWKNLDLDGAWSSLIEYRYPRLQRYLKRHGG